MTNASVDTSQRTAAWVVGFCYLFAMAAAVLAEFYVRAHLLVPDNPAATADNIVAHERLFRLGIASHLVACVTDVVLITALYIVLRPINRSLALLAMFWRLMETAILVVLSLPDFDVLRLLSGAAYLRGLEGDLVRSLATLSIGAHGAGYDVALLFFGFGSTLFCYLWFQSRYIPRILAAWGMFASLLFVPLMFAFILFPDVARAITAPFYAAPIALFEVTTGAWLLLRGIRPAVPPEPDATGGA